MNNCFRTKLTLTTRLTILVFVCCLFAWWQTAQAQSFNFNPVSYKLKNGLQVIVVEDPSLPVVTSVLAYGVGSVNDPEGKEGLAYLMQNLMFQGSENIGPLQHLNYIQNVGGELNAATTFDKTFFYETVPSNQLGLVLWLESDRMHFLQVSEATLAREKENLIRKENERYLQEPFSRYFFLIDQILYPDSRYGHPLTGSAQSLRSLTLDDVQKYYRRYYVPNNAVLCLCGDLKLARVRELVSRYFETIPSGEEPGPYPTPEFIPSLSARDQVMVDPLVSSPALQFGVRLENLKPEDLMVLGLMEQVLIQGPTSRLMTRLIKKERLAVFMSGGLEERGPFQSLKIFLLANNQIMAERAKKALAEELNRLKTEMVPDREFLKAKNNYKFNYLNQLTGNNLSRALALADLYLKEGRLPDINRELNRLEKLTPYSILALARRQLREEKYCFLTILPRY
ncbi:MAG: insulinase family protein [Candidatus Saccharicenans sp.]|jgi:predicted Zn-dependent peptidase|nr:insulinase family protein [Candidatus Saccharicenans sp.]MDH7493374.1 pitrilysin family protein [Candidatus Saccharicenans sp.]